MFCEFGLLPPLPTPSFSIYFLYSKAENIIFFFKKKNRGRCRGTDVECFVRDENWPRRVPKLDMKKYIMNQGESDPADGLTAFDGIQPDPVLSQDVEVQDAALANDVEIWIGLE